MSSNLDIYKRNRINELNKEFNASLARLKSTLATNINNIKWSRSKASQINSLINQYNIAVKNLTNSYNKNLNAIKNFQPKPVIINNSKHALLVGINYTGTQNELYGCINDTISVNERISKNGFNDVTFLTDNTPNKPTKTNILNAFKNMLKSSNPGDLLFFCYSGHGSYTIDKNNDETTGLDQMIIPIDLNPIVDDELKTIIQNNLKEGVTLFAMFDSCFSGSVLDLRYQYMDSLNYDKYTEYLKEQETKGDVFMISGCNDRQTSADAYINGSSNGAMTWSLLEALKQKPNCSWRELLKLMRDLLKSNGYDQIPQFSTGNFENIDTQVFI